MELNIHNIGKKVNKIIVFGGVYSNLQALESLRQNAENEGISPENIFCSGDILGYCAQPIECINFIQSWGIHAIQGNVEENIVSGFDECGCNFTEGGRCDIFSKQWYPFVASQMNVELLSFLENLPKWIQFTYGGKNITLLHGSASHISEFIFKSTPWEKKLQQLVMTNSDIILAGHCGIPFIDSNKDKHWINAGVIGMPANDGTNDVWFTTLEEYGEKIVCQFHRLVYDFTSAKNKMLAVNLPLSYAHTLETGIWDNCEILPESEMIAQGKIINLDKNSFYL